MKNVRTWSAVTVVGAGLCAATVAAALPSSAAPQFTVDATTTKSLFAIPCPSCILHSAPAGAHTGGTEYDAGTITNLRGKRIGNFVIEETGMTPFNDGPGRVQLVGTIVIGSSQLTFQGVEEPPLDGGVAAVTGGTGRYAGARGQITYRDRSDTVTRLVIHLNN